MESFSAVVLAAGEGRRLRPLTRNRPKPMLPAGTRPILERVFDQLVDAGVTDITVVVGYQRERVQSHFGPTYRNVPIRYVTQERQLGSGHAVLAAEDAVDGPLLVINGDQLVDSRIVEDVLAAHQDARSGASEAPAAQEDERTTDGEDADGPPSPDGERTTDADGGTDVGEEVPVATVGVLARRDVSTYGGVILEGDEVVELVERPADDREYRLNAGVYALEPRIFETIRATEPRSGEQSLVDAISRLVDAGERVRGVESEGLWVDATYPWDLLYVATELFDEGVVAGDRDSGVSRSATIHESATVRAPVTIDDDCEVGPGAVIGPYACLGENVTVEANAVVSRSVLDADSRVRPNATVVDCVAGQGVEVGAGTTIPGGPGDVRVGDRVFEDERLGALLADRCRDEGGVTYVPGAVVGPGVRVRAGATVHGTVEEGTEVRS